MIEFMKKLSVVWKEMDEQIPLMREAVRNDLKKDFETFVHDDAHIQQELNFYKKSSDNILTDTKVCVNTLKGTKVCGYLIETNGRT